MGDYPNPNVVTVVKIGGFTLYCKAFRRLTKEEMKQAAALWLRQSRRKSFPKTGSGEVISLHGFDQE